MVRKLKNPKNRMFLLFYLENNNFKPLSSLFYPQIPVKSRFIIAFEFSGFLVFLFYILYRSGLNFPVFWICGFLFQYLFFEGFPRQNESGI